MALIIYFIYPLAFLGTSLLEKQFHTSHSATPQTAKMSSSHLVVPVFIALFSVLISPAFGTECNGHFDSCMASVQSVLSLAASVGPEEHQV